jgi:chromosome segregation ATPase
MSEEIELMLLSDVRSLQSEIGRVDKENRRLRERVNELESPMSYIPPSEDRAKAVAAIERAKSEEYRALYLAAVQALESKERSGGSLHSEFAAAVAALDGMKRERDEARKALGEEQAEREAFNRENVSLRFRVRELETELQERGAGYGRT